MDLLKQTKELCKIYNIKPSRSKGQNFLIVESIYDKIIEAADLSASTAKRGEKKDDVVLEVGPGLGFLTVKLAEKAKKVIAVELDDKLAEVLRIGLKAKGIKNVEVVNENILDLTRPDKSGHPILNRRGLARFAKSASWRSRRGRGNFKVVANLPFNITSIFLRKFLSAKIKPKLMVLMLQKEVAERIIAKPGKMNLLAVSVQFYAKPKIIEIVPAGNFWPKPEVDSAIIKIVGTGQCPVQNEKDFFRLVKIGFSAKRKMLKNNLANGYHISQSEAEEKIKKAGFNAKIRAQELGVGDWARLLKCF